MFGVVGHMPEVWRVGRSEDPWSFSSIDPGEALRDTGNRFDIPGGQVLYTATDLEACYRETLGRFRPSAEMRRLVPASEPGMMAVGSVPADWRVRRVKVKGVVDTSLAVVDLMSPETHEELNNRLASVLDDQGLSLIDVSSVTSMNRILTRAIASQIYAEQDPITGEPLYAGIRYISKLGLFDCWALFGDRFVVDEQSRGPVERDDPELLKVASSWGLTIH